MVDVHQIRLSGDPEFQKKLRELRIRACAMGVSTGSVTEIGSLAVSAATAPAVLDLLERGELRDLRRRAKAPDATYLALRGRHALALKRLRGGLIALSAPELPLRTIAHLAIVLLAEAPDDTLRSLQDTHQSKQANRSR